VSYSLNAFSSPAVGSGRVARPGLLRSLAVVLVLLLLSIVGLIAYSRGRMSDRSVQIIVPILQEEPTALVPAAPPAQPPAPQRGLAAAPDPRLVEESVFGILPKIGADGSKASDVYARPVTPIPAAGSHQPMIAILLLRSGIGQVVTTEAALSLPPQVSFSISPYAGEIQRQVTDIRTEGHEVFVEVPTSGQSSTSIDPGPHAIDDTLPDGENRDRLHWILGRFPGAIGLISGPDTASASMSVRLLHSEADQRGLFWVPLHGVEKNEPTSVIRLDPESPPEMMDHSLKLLEDAAARTGSAIAIAEMGPVAIDRLGAWAAGLEKKGIRLVPVSAVLRLGST